MQGASTRAWMVGAATGVVLGVVTAATGFMAGCCCLFQFANVLVPSVAGIVAGGAAAAMAPWATAEAGTNGVMTGALLGLRAGALASLLASGIGLVVSLGWPILSALLAAMGSDGIWDALVSTILVMGWSLGMGALFAFGGALGGTVLGVGAGAVAGLLFAPKA